MQRLVFPLALAVLATPIAAQDFNWSGRLSRGQTLEVRGVNGTIDAVPATGAEARVRGVKQEGRRGDADDVQIVTVPHEGGMLICAVYPDNDPEDVCRPDGRGRGHHRVRDNDTEVNFRIEVPAGVMLAAQTVNGDVDIRDLQGDVHAATVNGDLMVGTAGFAEGSTVNGTVRIRMGRADWSGAAEYSTVNGSIVIEMPAGVSAGFEASTVNGEIESDFPITIQGRWGPRRASGTIGDGSSARSLRLRTVNGDITLRRI